MHRNLLLVRLRDRHDVKQHPPQLVLEWVTTREDQVLWTWARSLVWTWSLIVYIAVELTYLLQLQYVELKLSFCHYIILVVCFTASTQCENLDFHIFPYSRNSNLTSSFYLILFYIMTDRLCSSYRAVTSIKMKRTKACKYVINNYTGIKDWWKWWNSICDVCWFTAVYRIVFYITFMCLQNLNLDQEFHVLGQQRLSELRDKIVCISDNLTVGDFSENPDTHCDTITKVIIADSMSVKTVIWP